MTLTLLLDLDDTLLENDIYKFLPHYLGALGKHLADIVPPEKTASEILAATNAIISNQQPGQTLGDAFDSIFYAAIGTTKHDLAERIDDFYTRIFPTLQPLTRPKAGARTLVEYALRRGHRVVIATNPLFPATAIFQRLKWAQLDPKDFPFALISSFETFHFAKPNPAFLAECLGRLGWPPGPIVMVGNSRSEDLAPASALGLPFYLVTEQPDGAAAVMPQFSCSGALEGALNWLKDIEDRLPEPEFKTPEALLAILRSTPALLHTFGRNLREDRWHIPLGADEWCFTEIICHLRDADQEINLSRLERILSEDNAFMAAVNADAWLDIRSYCQEPGLEALKSFIQIRTELLHRLENLSPQQWDSGANHAIFGPTDLRELVAFITQHDRTHIQQALKTIQAAEAVA